RVAGPRQGSRRGGGPYSPGDRGQPGPGGRGGTPTAAARSLRRGKLGRAVSSGQWAVVGIAAWERGSGDEGVRHLRSPALQRRLTRGGRVAGPASKNGWSNSSAG